MSTTGAAVTVGEWLTRLEPTPPDALLRRLQELLAEDVSRPAAEVPEACLTAGERLLDNLLQSGSTSRATALDLLAVDALVTYAFEAAADDPTRIVARATAAMQRIAALPGTLAT